MEEYAHFWERHKTISCYYAALTRAACAGTGLTQMEYDIIMFLHYHPQLNTAADMVKIRKATKSHVSTALKNLEDRGFIESGNAKATSAATRFFSLRRHRKLLRLVRSCITILCISSLKGSTARTSMYSWMYLKICAQMQRKAS